MVRVNGNDMDAAGMTVSQLIEKLEYSTSRIAVECNGEIVPKRLHAVKVLNDGDTVEVVTFVGGG